MKYQAVFFGKAANEMVVCCKLQVVQYGLNIHLRLATGARRLILTPYSISVCWSREDPFKTAI